MHLPNPSPRHVNDTFNQFEKSGVIGSTLFASKLRFSRPGLSALVDRIREVNGDEIAAIAILIFWLMDTLLEEREEATSWQS